MGASFPTCTCLRHDGNLVATRDTMESCGHKETRCPRVATRRHRHLILSWFRAGGNDLIGRRRWIHRQAETDRQKSLWLENAASHRNRGVSPEGAHPIRAENIPEILLRRPVSREDKAACVLPAGICSRATLTRRSSHPTLPPRSLSRRHDFIVSKACAR